MLSLDPRTGAGRERGRKYSLSLFETESFLTAVVKADRSERDVAFEYIGRIADACARRGVDSVLIENRIPGAQWFLDVIAIMGTFSCERLAAANIAMVLPALGSQFGSTGFGVDRGPG